MQRADAHGVGAEQERKFDERRCVGPRLRKNKSWGAEKFMMAVTIRARARQAATTTALQSQFGLDVGVLWGLNICIMESLSRHGRKLFFLIYHGSALYAGPASCCTNSVSLAL